MTTTRRNIKSVAALLAAGLMTLLGATLAVPSAQAQTWNKTAAATYAWGQTANWTPGTIPNTAGATANLNNNIAGNIVVDLNTATAANRTVGTLNIGDSDGSHRFDIAGFGRTLFFDVSSGSAALNFNASAAAASHTISCTVQANDNLIIANNKVGTGGINLAGAVNENTAGRIVTLNGVSGSDTMSFGGSNGFTKLVVNANAIFNSLRLTDDRALGKAHSSVTDDAVTLNGGSLRVGDDGTIAIIANRGIALGTGGGTFLVNGGRHWTVNSIVTGWGNLTVAGGAGVLTLSAANTYEGDTKVQTNATLKVTSANALPSSTTLRLTSDSGANPGKLDLSFSGERTVRALYFDGVRQAAGTWGFTGSGAANINTTWFTGGTGTLNVMAETTPGGAFTETFDSAASAAANGWVGVGNTTMGNNIVWNNSSNAGGTAGEVLGVFARSGWDVTHYYADTTIGTLSRTDTLQMKGKFRLTDSNMDGNIYLGFFQPGVVQSGNFLGISIAEPSSLSQPFRGFAGVTGTGGASTGVISLPQNTTVAFDLTWTGSADGSGTLTGTVAGTDIGTVSVGAGAGTFEAFGLLAGGAGNDSARKTGSCYFDDLTYVRIPRGTIIRFL